MIYRRRKIKKKLILLADLLAEKKNRYIPIVTIVVFIGLLTYLYLNYGYNENIDNIKKDLEKNPTNIENCIRLGNYYYKKAINGKDRKKNMLYYDEIIKYYCKAIVLDKEEVIDPAIYSRLGIVYFKKSVESKGNYYYSEALQELEEAIDRGYNSYETYLYLGHIFFKDGRYDKAILNYKNALNIKENDIKVLFNIAWSYKAKGDYKVAEEEFKKILKQKSISRKIKLNTYLGLGEVCYYNNLDKEALKYCKKAIEIDKDSSQAKYWLGKVYLKMGKSKEAKKEWKKIISIDPKGK
ncbi:MAG: tetratricopeptide repeat protein [bacterium]|nr:tetratricopeptide repeat protein [bacterium]